VLLRRGLAVSEEDVLDHRLNLAGSARPGDPGEKDHDDTQKQHE